jgi:hypothetical protein
MMLKYTFFVYYAGVALSQYSLSKTVGKKRESVVFPVAFIDQIGVSSGFVRVQVNQLSAVMSTIYLLPCLFKVASPGIS